MYITKIKCARAVEIFVRTAGVPMGRMFDLPALDVDALDDR